MRIYLCLAVTLFLIGLTISGCSTFKDTYLYKIIGLNLHNEDNSGSKIADVSTAPVPARAYGIRLEYLIKADGTTGPDLDPDQTKFSCGNKVTTFQIYSLSAFDSLHPALSNLNDYFLYGIGTSVMKNSSTINNAINSGIIGIGYT